MTCEHNKIQFSYATRYTRHKIDDMFRKLMEGAWRHKLYIFNSKSKPIFLIRKNMGPSFLDQMNTDHVFQTQRHTDPLPYHYQN